MQCMQLPTTYMTCIVATAAQLQILKTGRLWWWGGRWIYQKCADTPDSDENHDHQNFHSDDEAGFVHTGENSWQTHLYLVCVGDTVCSGWKIANAVDTPISQVTSKTGHKKQTDDTLMCTQMMQIYVHKDDADICAVHIAHTDDNTAMCTAWKENCTDITILNTHH